MITITGYVALSRTWCNRIPTHGCACASTLCVVVAFAHGLMLLCRCPASGCQGHCQCQGADRQQDPPHPQGEGTSYVYSSPSSTPHSSRCVNPGHNVSEASRRNHHSPVLCLQGLAPSIPEDLYHLIKKAVSVRKHMEKNRQDKDSKFRLILIESRVHRLARYYKKRSVLPANWRYESATASALVS